MSSQVIVVGGGLAGLSAAHTVIEQGGVVLLFDKKPFLGGNSVKATSGINGALTRTQRKLGINDSPEKFEEDTAISGSKGASNIGTPLGKVLTHGSGPAVEWLMDAFDLDLSIVSRMGGHSEKRCHRGKERFPGMTITMALLEKLEKIEKESNGKVAKIMSKCKVTKFIKENKKIIGVEFEDAKGRKGKAYGPVIVATGGYGADFSKSGILLKYRPDLENYSTTNGDHCTGDGIKMAMEIGASVVDMEYVQVHPTGLVNLKDPNAKVKFLAAEALRGVGGILLNPEGKRFCNELGRRDYVSAEMEKGKGPYRLVLNSQCSKEIEWHCKHYEGRGLMKRYESAEELAKDMEIDPEVLAATFKKYNDNATPEKDEFGKKYHTNLPFKMNDYYYVAIVTPVVHYCMGGLKISTKSEVMSEEEVIPGLFATGEVCGGVHGKNRLGGSSLLDCVVFGRVSGRSATKFLLENLKDVKQITNGNENEKIGITIGNTKINIETKNNKVSISWDKSSSNEEVEEETKEEKKEEVKEETKEEKKEEKKEESSVKFFTAEDVAKHNTENDCWVIVNGEVLDVTSFLNEHPGGRGAILLFAGKDASAEFNMLHKPDVVLKYAPQCILGKLAGEIKSHL